MHQRMNRILTRILPARLRAWLAAAAVCWLVALPAQGAAAFLDPEQAFRLSVEAVDGQRAVLRWDIAPGYYLYRDRIDVQAAPGERIGAIERPPGERKDDPNFGPVEVYHDEARVTVDRAGATSLQVGWQGCADSGLCYLPQQQTVSLGAPAALAATAGTAGPSGTTATASASTAGTAAAATAAPAAATAGWGDLSTDSGISRMLAQRALWWTLPVAFVLGIALAFTPCVLPMVPIVSGIVVGSQATPRRSFALALSFVLAMALVYAGLGVLAALAGAGLQAWMQNPWTLLAFATVFVALALAMFGFYELQLPAFLRDRFSGTQARGGSIGGAAGMGALSALLVGPCMTAPLAGTLLYIAQTGNVLQGALLLFALGLGMGVPLLVISTAGARWLPRPGAWMNRVKATFGFLLLATAIWMAERVVPAPVTVLAWGALLTGLGVSLWHAARPATGAGPLLARSTALVAGLWGGAMVLGAAAGAADPARPLLPLAQARANPAAGPVQASAPFETITDPQVLLARLEAASGAGRPALVEFSAEWCTSCKTIEKKVFGDPQVIRALDGVVLLRADVTASTAEQLKFMRERQVMGPPTLLLYDGQGQERREQRLVGEFRSADLLQRDPAGAAL